MLFYAVCIDGLKWTSQQIIQERLFIPFWSPVSLTRNGPWMTLMSIITNEPTQLLLRQPYYLLGMSSSKTTMCDVHLILFSSSCRFEPRTCPMRFCGDTGIFNGTGSMKKLFWPLLPIKVYKIIFPRYVFLVEELFYFIAYMESESACSVFNCCWRLKRWYICQTLEERHSI